MTDQELLEAVYMHRTLGISCAKVGERFGKSRNMIAGLMHRIKNDTDMSDPDGNQNGTMPAKWWKR